MAAAQVAALQTASLPRLDTGGSSEPSTPAHQAALEPGCLVWSPCVQDGFKRSRVLSVDPDREQLVVKSGAEEDSPVDSVRYGDVRPYFSCSDGLTCADNTSLVHLDDANILDNMCRRFHDDDIYTYTATVLLAVNPYKPMDHLYGDERIAEYQNGNMASLPPHPHAVAGEAYRNLMRERCNQALVISGESGAGKTETAKITMRYLTRVSRTDAAQGGQISDKIINASPILESFGNASTVRNRNSSRFGKYNEMHFNRVGSLVGAGIKTYLLESSRVVFQQEREQNYHLFYELLAGLDSADLDELQLDSATRYQLLYPGSAQPLPAGSPEVHRRAQQFAEVKRALEIIGVTAGNGQVEGFGQQDLWEVVAALIHLGEVNFAEVGDGELASAERGQVPEPSTPGPPEREREGENSPSSQEPLVEVTNHDDLSTAADLLGISVWRLRQVLQMREVHVKKQSRRASHISCPRSSGQAAQVLRGILKILYQRLFDRVVQCINESSAATGASATAESSTSHIGTLDIYGFERLHVNSLEQLCINFANERLQQFFIEEVLMAEQKMYREECLHIPPMQLPDSKPVVDSIVLMLSVLDDHSLRGSKGLVRAGDDQDQKYCENVLQRHAPDRSRQNGPVMYLRMTGGRNNDLGLGQFDGFAIRHYAGDVAYQTRGWIEKNNDALVPEVEALLSSSTKRLVKGLSNLEAADTMVGERFHSVSNKYLGDLSSLLTALSKCSVHYIRCFNPNKVREAGVFDKRYVLDQVVQCGTVELVRIMHHGFPHRVLLKDLRRRFANSLPECFARYSDHDFVIALMLAFEMDSSQWTRGETRLFLRAGQLGVLEQLRNDGHQVSQAMVWKIRMVFARKKVRAAALVVSIARWWPKHLAAIRKERVAKTVTRLANALYVYVRLHRWLQRAGQRKCSMLSPNFSSSAIESGAGINTRRLSSEGWPKRRDIDLLFGCGSRRRSAAPRPSGARIPQIFVALNTCEEPDYASYLQKDVEAGNRIHDKTLKLWQYQTTESVLFYDGRHLLSARLSPKPFLRQAGSHVPADLLGPNVPVDTSLSDVRIVDIHESGRALLVDGDTPPGDIACMCQHPRKMQLFATCSGENRITVWEWKGTDSDVKRPSTEITRSFDFGREWDIHHMCFMLDAPQRIKDEDGVVLLILCSPIGRQRLEIVALSVFHTHHRAELAHPVLVDSPSRSYISSLNTGGPQISFFTSSHTGSIVVLGGCGILHFYSLQDNAGELAMTLIEDCASLPAVRESYQVSCLCLPPPTRTSNILDWIVTGDSKGKIYGFRFNTCADGSIERPAGGRFRTNTHSENVPIRSLVASYGGGPDAHYRTIKDRGISYSLFLKRGVDQDEKCFLSLGDDGKLLTWQLLDEGGWMATDERIVDVRDGPSPTPEPVERLGALGPFAAAHTSRLAPHVVVVLDKERRRLTCHDRTGAVEQSEECQCFY